MIRPLAGYCGSFKDIFSGERSKRINRTISNVQEIFKVTRKAEKAA